MFTDKELINLPKLTIGVPLGHNQAACLTHLLVNQLGDIRVSLEDLREEGATLVLSCHTRAYPGWMEEDNTENTALIKQYWEDYMQAQKVKYDMDKPMTMEDLEIHNSLTNKGIINYADPEYWSSETLEYNADFEKDLLDNPFDDWEEGEDYD